MEFKRIQGDFSVCKVQDYTGVCLNDLYCFTGRSEEENSLICQTQMVPANTISREDGYKAFRIEGVLDFSLIGILARISALLAEEKIGILAVSTFNTDYFFVKANDEMHALNKLASSGYTVKSGVDYGDYFLNRTASDILGEYSEHRDEWVYLSPTPQK